MDGREKIAKGGRILHEATRPESIADGPRRIRLHYGEGEE